MMNNISLKSIKYESIKSIMTVISESDSISRADIAAQTGLSLVTVGKIADALLSMSIICQVKSVKAQAGRRAGLISINADMFSVIFDISSYDFKMSVLDLRLRLKDRITYTYRSDLSYIDNLNVFFAESKALVSRKHDMSNCFGIGVAVPGPYNDTSDTVNSRKIPEIRSVNIKKALSAYFPPELVIVDSFVNAAAKSNISHVDSYNTKNILYWYIGNSVCGAYTVSGKLILGKDNHTCDLGSIIQFGDLTLEDKIKLCKSQEECVDAMTGIVYNLLMVLNPHTVIMEFDTPFSCDSVLPLIKESLMKKYRLKKESMPEFIKASYRYRSSHRGLTLRLREIWLDHLVFDN